MITRVRVGIDVGGTFTHAVAIDNASLEVLGHAVTPTSHRSSSGVAAGVVQAFAELRKLLPEEHEVVFLAHSTTQATNALLEGDVVRVAILGLAGAFNWKGRLDMNVGRIELAPGKYLDSVITILPVAEPGAIRAAVANFQEDPTFGALVAAQPFSVDDPTGENLVLEGARAAGMAACSTSEMSGLYGLRVRTRTAVLNASIMPKMIETAEMTERSLRESDVHAPLMVMRSDGGVMSLEEVRRRPVMTLLSGPAAGIAAALVYLRASDAFFLEVGGTSTDICLIKNGRAAIRSASLGGFPTYLKTLDSRTLGVAGGSMVRRRTDGAIEVGPRSAHLANCKYASFVEPAFFAGAKIEEASPLKGDPTYLIMVNGEERVALTTTDAANFLGFVPEGDYATGNPESNRLAFELAGAHWRLESKALAASVLDSAARKIEPTIKQMVSDYGVKDRVIKLIGGGGGAAAIVPYLAQRLKVPFEIAPRAEVISAIGAALAMVKETVERNILNPTSAEIAAVRYEAEQAVLKMGADPHTLQVNVEVDNQRNIVRATASGSVEFIAQDLLEQHLSEPERVKALAESAPHEQGFVLQGRTETFYVYASERERKSWFGLRHSQVHTLWVTDGRGAIKLQVPGGKLHPTSCAAVGQQLEAIVAANSTYGDVGTSPPNLYLVVGHKILDYCGLSNAPQLLATARDGLTGLESSPGAAFAITA